jgi:hypothetical protein
MPSLSQWRLHVCRTHLAVCLHACMRACACDRVRESARLGAAGVACCCHVVAVAVADFATEYHLRAISIPAGILT